MKEISVVTAWNEMRDLADPHHRSGPLADGRTVILQSMIDLTEQRRLEEALRRNQEEMRVRLAELEALYSSAPLGLAMLDKDLRFVRANEALATINGMPAADHIGRFVFDIVPHRQRDAEPVMRRSRDRASRSGTSNSRAKPAESRAPSAIG